jgi:hypothetical protein
MHEVQLTMAASVYSVPDMGRNSENKMMVKTKLTENHTQ